MNKSVKRIIGNIFYPVLALAIILALWAIISKVEEKPLILPQVDVVFHEFFLKFGDKEFWIAILNTLKTTLFTFILAMGFALIISIISTLLRPVAKIMSPICTILRSAPTMAVILLSVLWIKEPVGSAILIGFLIAFPLLYALFYSSLQGVDKDLLEMAKVYKVSKSEQIKNIYIPSVLPSMLDAVQSTISLTLKVVIATEVMAYVRDSIGFNMMEDNINFEIESLLAWTIAAIVLSFLLEGIVLIFKKIAEVKYGYNTK